MPTAKKPAAKKPVAKAAARSSATKPAAKTVAKAAKPAVKAAAAAHAAAKRPAAKAAPTKVAPATAPPAKPAAKGAAKRGVTLDKFLEGQQKALLDERDTYTRQADLLAAEAELLAADMEPGDTDFGEEGGEGATIAVERERDLALSLQARAAVDEIDRALARIDAGMYGICETCGQTIPKERLKALPQAALCVRCKSGGLGRR